MATVITPSEQTTLLRNISWATYRSLLVDYKDSSAPRVTFDQGLLQIMSPSTRHERLNRRLATFVEVVLEVREIEFDNVGSNTFKREDLQRGFEPDSSFYIQSVESVSDREQIDLAVDPPPDVVIEIDITHPSLDKLPIFAAVGVPEVWRCDGAQVVILKLASGSYVEATESVALPRVTSDVLTRFMQASEQQKRTAWLRDVRAWARMK
ncbi:MAG: Uma2 family endonuclease [Acidobacteriota bacterium]|nr:Uma2 family endonuclease [Acidobacteriota bacterium]